MQSLLNLLTKLGPAFIFLFLEGLCLYLIVRYNDPQREIYVSSANAFSGAVMSRYSRWSGYFSLERENQKLREQNAALLANQANAFYDNADRMRSDTVLGDSSEVLQLFTFIPAEVINNAITGKNNMLTLNRGRRHGISPPMGVITDNGIVGIVRQSTAHYSSVMSILHSQTRISAAIRNKGSFGSLVWKNGDYRFMRLEDIPRFNPIHKGDTVETSGFSSLFPKGVMIGTIEQFEVPAGESNYEIWVKLSADMSRLRHAYVVNNLMKKEFSKLKQQKEDE